MENEPSRRMPWSIDIPSCLVWLGLALCVLAIAHSRQYQWDFKVFHAAPAVLQSGGDPYDKVNPSTDIPQDLFYLYPPVMLYVFLPLSKLPYGAAYLVWLAAKLLALGCLVLLWHRHFERLSARWSVVLFLIIGYNATLLMDLTAGNISMFEELGVWFGFFLLIRNRPYLAGIVLAAIAQFKFIPIVFSGLLLILPPKPRWTAFVVSVLAFGALLSLNLIVTPELTSHYIHSLTTGISDLDERGIINPSALAFIRDLGDLVAKQGWPVSPRAIDLIYCAYAASMALVFLWLPRKQLSAIAARDPRIVIYYVCVLYVLTMPRMKDYSYIIVLIPSLFIIREIVQGRLKRNLLVPLVGVLIFLPTWHSVIPVLRIVLPWLQSYLPWFVAWCVLYYFVRFRMGWSVQEDAEPARFDGVIASLPAHE
jgi:hypothetical protein